jgi:hypothetical protein
VVLVVDKDTKQLRGDYIEWVMELREKLEENAPP